MICEICGLDVEECPMLNGEMNMCGSPDYIKGIPNRKTIKDSTNNINKYF